MEARKKADADTKKAEAAINEAEGTQKKAQEKIKKTEEDQKKAATDAKKAEEAQQKARNEISDLEKKYTWYGNYCGRGNTGTGAAIQDRGLDTACKAHDAAYTQRDNDYERRRGLLKDPKEIRQLEEGKLEATIKADKELLRQMDVLKPSGFTLTPKDAEEAERRRAAFYFQQKVRLNEASLARMKEEDAANKRAEEARKKREALEREIETASKKIQDSLQKLNDALLRSSSKQ